MYSVCHFRLLRNSCTRGVYCIFCSSKFLFQGSMTVLENSDFKQEMWYVIERLGRVLVSSSHRMQQKALEIPDFCRESSVSKHSCVEGRLHWNCCSDGTACQSCAHVLVLTENKGNRDFLLLSWLLPCCDVFSSFLKAKACYS